MNVGFDLDGVFIGTPPFIPSWLIEKLYRKENSHELAYRIPGTLEQIIRRISHVPFLRPPIQKNIAFLQNLTKKENVSLFLISSRFGFLKHPTEVVLQKYGLQRIFHRIFFNFKNEQPHIFKEKVLNKLHIDRFVDDDLALLQFLSKKNTHIQFYWLNTYQQKKLGKNLLAITQLSQVFE